MRRGLDEIIRKYRPIIIEKLYEKEGYKFQHHVHLDNGNEEVIMLIYVKKVKQ